ncbi:hypothetical protein FGE12_14245 [Aggregicoccus sp. 17bor-14]|uniref:hypothetical protein n=1 Tax=Myxococcaceae TaxID=31 RepID=UPI00129C5D2B|nr:MULTISPECIES: hypothetical protein [Myxococcaceae]MBF5043553.1 hypothetical protein [Simulacricoccus sp. 17bor-14]MRI89313.1 hypothetical protein [Aggregicoccus sp. 17bor-14]
MWKLLKHSLGLPWLGGASAARRPSQAERAAAWQQAVHRAYPRLHAPSMCRPAGPYAAFVGRAPVRVALRGLMVLTDEAPQVGSLLELEVFADPDGNTITLVVKVEAVHENPPDAPARYDVAMAVCDMDAAALPRLRELLQ